MAYLSLVIVLVFILAFVSKNPNPHMRIMVKKVEECKCFYHF
jgi:hypothetical protein